MMEKSTFFNRLDSLSDSLSRSFRKDTKTEVSTLDDDFEPLGSSPERSLVRHNKKDKEVPSSDADSSTAKQPTLVQTPTQNVTTTTKSPATTTTTPTTAGTTAPNLSLPSSSIQNQITPPIVSPLTQPPPVERSITPPISNPDPPAVPLPPHAVNNPTSPSVPFVDTFNPAFLPVSAPSSYNNIPPSASSTSSDDIVYAPAQLSSRLITSPNSSSSFSTKPITPPNSSSFPADVPTALSPPVPNPSSSLHHVPPGFPIVTNKILYASGNYSTSPPTSSAAPTATNKTSHESTNYSSSLPPPSTSSTALPTVANKPPHASSSSSQPHTPTPFISSTVTNKTSHASATSSSSLSHTPTFSTPSTITNSNSHRNSNSSTPSHNTSSRVSSNLFSPPYHNSSLLRAPSHESIPSISLSFNTTHQNSTSSSNSLSSRSTQEATVTTTNRSAGSSRDDFFHEYERQLHERTKELNLRERSIAEKEKEIQRRMQFLMDSEEWLRTRWDKLMEREQVVLTTNKPTASDSTANDFFIMADKQTLARKTLQQRDSTFYHTDPPPTHHYQESKPSNDDEYYFEKEKKSNENNITNNNNYSIINNNNKSINKVSPAETTATEKEDPDWLLVDEDAEFEQQDLTASQGNKLFFQKLRSNISLPKLSNVFASDSIDTVGGAASNIKLPTTLKGNPAPAHAPVVPVRPVARSRFSQFEKIRSSHLHHLEQIYSPRESLIAPQCLEYMHANTLNKALEPMKMGFSVVLTEKEMWTPCPRCGEVVERLSRKYLCRLCNENLCGACGNYSITYSPNLFAYLSTEVVPKLPPTTISPVCTHCRDLVAYRMRAQELRETVARAHEDPVALRYAELRDLLSEVHKKVNKYTTAKSTSSGEDSKTAKAELENLMGQFHKQLAKFPHPSQMSQTQSKVVEAMKMVMKKKFWDYTHFSPLPTT